MAPILSRTQLPTRAPRSPSLALFLLGIGPRPAAGVPRRPGLAAPAGKLGAAPGSYFSPHFFLFFFFSPFSVKLSPSLSHSLSPPLSLSHSLSRLTDGRAAGGRDRRRPAPAGWTVRGHSSSTCCCCCSFFWVSGFGFTPEPINPYWVKVKPDNPLPNKPYTPIGLNPLTHYPLI